MAKTPGTEEGVGRGNARLNALRVAVPQSVNVTGKTDNEYLSDGTTEEPLNSLAKLPGGCVPARTWSFAFKAER